MGGTLLKERTEQLLKLVGMWGRHDRKVRDYSRGMLQRVGLAQALINDPDLVFMDEPTAGLDPIGAIQIREVIKRLRNEGKTVFLCSHLLKEMEPLCDAVAILNDGVVCRTGTMTELLSSPDDHYVADFRGLTQASVEQLQSLATTVTPKGDQYQASFPDQRSAVAAAEALVAGGAEIVELHPFHLSLEEVFIEAVGGIPQ